MEYQVILENNKQYLRFANVIQDQDTEFISPAMIVLDESTHGYIYEIFSEINPLDRKFIAEFNEIRDEIEPIENGMEVWEFAEKKGVNLETLNEDDDEIGYLEAKNNRYPLVYERDLRYPIVWSVEK